MIKTERSCKKRSVTIISEEVRAVQKSLHDRYTCALFISFVLLIVVCGVPVVSVPAASGPGHAAAVAVMMPASDEISVQECEVVYHRTSQGGTYPEGYPYRVEDKKNPSAARTVYAAVAEDEDEDDMGDLYYALYTCSGTAVTAGAYI